MIFLMAFFSSKFIMIFIEIPGLPLFPRQAHYFRYAPPSSALRPTKDIQEPQPRKKWQIRTSLEGHEERPPRTQVTVRPPANKRPGRRCSEDLQSLTVLCTSSVRSPTSKTAASKGLTHQAATPKDPTLTTSRSTCWTASSQIFSPTTSAWYSVQYNQSTRKLMLLLFCALLLRRWWSQRELLATAPFDQSRVTLTVSKIYCDSEEEERTTVELFVYDD